MAGWVKIDLKDLKNEEPVRKDRKHSFMGIHGKMGFPQYCNFCGLVLGKCYIAALCASIGCDFERDIRYQQWLKQVRRH
jgi:hypothetical protein